MFWIRPMLIVILRTFVTTPILSLLGKDFRHLKPVLPLDVVVIKVCLPFPVEVWLVVGLTGYHSLASTVNMSPLLQSRTWLSARGQHEAVRV